jgi:hypothetical protein
MERLRQMEVRLAELKRGSAELRNRQPRGARRAPSCVGDCWLPGEAPASLKPGQ